jgi:cytochrome c biogenesis protein ResB
VKVFYLLKKPFFRFETLPLTLYPTWIRPSIRKEKDPQRLFSDIRRFFSDRSLVVEQCHDTFKSLNTQKRQHLSVIEDNRSQLDIQLEEFTKITGMYKENVGSNQNQTRQVSIQQKNTTSQKRKLVLKVYLNLTALFFKSRKTRTGLQVLQPNRIPTQNESNKTRL